MITLSEFSRFEITNEKGDCAKLADLSVALLDGDYPPVTNLFYETGGKFMKLPCETVENIDLKNRKIKVFDLGAAKEVSVEAKNEYVLLNHEILDALLLDLENRRSIRANDLILEQTSSGLELRAADSSLSAILRRISFGFYKRISKDGIYDWKYVEFLRGNPDAARSGAGYHLRINRMPPGEIAQLINFLPYLHAAELITLLPDEKAVKTLEVMPLERRLQVFEELESEQAIRLLTLMAPDAAADLVGLLQTEMMKLYLEKLPRTQSERIIQLLRYPEDTAGGIMTNDIVYLPGDITVAEARLRMGGSFSRTDFIYLIYIISDEEKRILNGVISLRSLFSEADDKKLEEIMDPYIATLHPSDEVNAAAYRVVDSQLAAMPVVKIDRELVGAVTIDAAINQIAPGNERGGVENFFMNDELKPQGLEPIESVTAGLPTAPRRLSAGLRINLRGRSIKLRGLKRQPKGLSRWLLILGPGLIATSAGNDAGGIATYSSAGAEFGYDMIWVMLVLTLSFAVVQEMCARLGAATGRGLLALIRERFGIGWTLFIVGVVVVANGGVTLSEFVGIGAASELLGVSRYISVPIGAVLLWYLVIYGSYAKVEKIFLLMTLVFFAYPVAAFMGAPDWSAVARGAFIPTLKFDSAYIFLLVGVLGTTITPYIQIFQQSSVVERGAARRHYGPERIDAYFGSIFSNLMSISMIIATAATLYVVGNNKIESAADAAKALEPVVGASATTLFAIGLLGASLLAGAVLPLATSYAVSEAFGIPKGVNLDFRRGKTFFSIFTALIVVGAGIALIPNVPIFPLLVGIQVLNGVLLPIILVFILLLVNDRNLMGELKNSRIYNFLGWGTFTMISVAVIVMLGGKLLDLFGIQLFNN